MTYWGRSFYWDMEHRVPWLNQCSIHAKILLGYILTLCLLFPSRGKRVMLWSGCWGGWDGLWLGVWGLGWRSRGRGIQTFKCTILLLQCANALATNIFTVLDKGLIHYVEYESSCTYLQQVLDVWTDLESSIIDNDGNVEDGGVSRHPQLRAKVQVGGVWVELEDEHR